MEPKRNNAGRHVLFVALSVLVSVLGNTPTLASEDDESIFNINIGVISPYSSSRSALDGFPSRELILPAVQLALQRAMTSAVEGSGYSLRSSDIDKGGDWDQLRQSIIDAKEGDDYLGAIIGPVLASVNLTSDLARRLDTPLISLGVDFVNATSEEFQSGLNTLAGPINYMDVASMFVRIMETYNWRKIKLIFQELPNTGGFKSKYCSEAVRVLSSHLPRHGIDIEIRTTSEETIPLNYLQPQSQSNIIALCASPRAVRELMIGASDLGMAFGDHVFFNLDIFSSDSRPWYDSSDTNERNDKAARGFQAVKTISLRKPRSYDYRMFSSEVKRRSIAMFPDSTFSEMMLHPLVGYYHDAVILYTKALQEETWTNVRSIDGKSITMRMRDRSFEGITGRVTIDEKGVRVLDHSMSSFNPDRMEFEEVAIFHGRGQVWTPIEGTAIHWAGDRLEPPIDMSPQSRSSSIPSLARAHSDPLGEMNGRVPESDNAASLTSTNTQQP